MKKISVCIPSYNGGLYIEEQVHSILEQLSEFDEIIISDDSSTDDTISILEAIGDKRIFLLKNNKFKSPIYNLENAINFASGDVIILADQDDVWLPGRVKNIVDRLDQVELVFANGLIVDEFLNKTEKTIFKTLQPNKSVFGNLIKNSYIGCCLAFNSTLKTKILPFPSSLPMHDQWIGLIAQIYYQIGFINEPTILYRRHNSNASNTGEKSKNSFMKKLMFRLNIATSLCVRVLKLSFKQK